QNFDLSLRQGGAASWKRSSPPSGTRLPLRQSRTRAQQADGQSHARLSPDVDGTAIQSASSLCATAVVARYLLNAARGYCPTTRCLNLLNSGGLGSNSSARSISLWAFSRSCVARRTCASR